MTNIRPDRDSNPLGFEPQPDRGRSQSNKLIDLLRDVAKLKKIPNIQIESGWVHVVQGYFG